MMPRRKPDPREIERAAIHLLGRVLARLFRGRRGALVIAAAFAFGLALTPSAHAKPVGDEALLSQLEFANLSKLDAGQRQQVAKAIRKTRDARLARLGVETLRRVGDRESLRLLDAIAGGKSRVPIVDKEAIAVRARLASAEVRMRVAERMIQERLRAG